jgi:hypothetical protein
MKDVLSRLAARRGWPALVGLGLLLLTAGAKGQAQGQEVLPRLAEVGPWPVVSRLVGYQGRLWFANSVKGRNHNSADIYSFDPAEGELRYERHLFSQDAGRPLIADGLLYWPFEDGRISLGWGDFMATDGEVWQLGTVPSAEIFHVHDLAEVGGRLVAATSAWRAGLQASDDGGRSWRALYDHPTPDRRVSRITELIEVNGRALAYLQLRDERRVLVLDGDGVAELAGWPKDPRLHGWARHGGWVYGLVEDGDGSAVWRSDGVAVEQVAPVRSGWRPRALAVGVNDLWAVTAEGEGGVVWRSPDGRTWERVHTIEGGRPHEVAVTGGWLFVGGAGEDGTGALWGERLGSPSASGGLGSSDAPWGGWTLYPPIHESVFRRLDAALADPESYQDYGAVLRDLVFDLAHAIPVPEIWVPFLSSDWPEASQSHFSDGSAITAEMLGRWILLWGMSLSDKGDVAFEWLNAFSTARVNPAGKSSAAVQVPLDWLAEPWATPANPAEKYYATAPGAIWTVGQIGQDDAATIDALVARLERPDDPLWLTGDVVGALTALTGERFAYDRAAWRDWWEKARIGWPE